MPLSSNGLWDAGSRRRHQRLRRVRYARPAWGRHQRRHRARPPRPMRQFGLDHERIRACHARRQRRRSASRTAASQTRPASRTVGGSKRISSGGPRTPSVPNKRGADESQFFHCSCTCCGRFDVHHRPRGRSSTRTSGGIRQRQVLDVNKRGTSLLSMRVSPFFVPRP
jgi:hypothetical protein